MIYTMTLNPSLDYTVTVDSFQLGRTNRTAEEFLFPGGKGINVSTVLTQLGIPSTALGFLGGFTGDEIRRRTEERGIRCDFIQVKDGISRINVKLQSVEGTEINGKGPVIRKEEKEEIMKKLDLLQRGDTLVLAGSVPQGMPESIYSEMLSYLQGREILTVVDTTGPLLLASLAHHPFLIKPNNHELGELFGVRIEEREQVIPYAKKLQERGARNVLVSLAGKGAVLAAEDGTVCSQMPPRGELVNGVGAGDSMVAGFLAGWQSTGDYREAFRMGLAAGTASAYSELLALRTEILEMYKRVKEEEHAVL